MKKVLYYLPFIIFVLFYSYILLLDFNSLQSTFLIIILLPLIAGVLMDNNKWWGSIIGLILGIILIYMGIKDTGQIINERIIGVIIIVYYIICGITCYRKTGKQNL